MNKKIWLSSPHMGGKELEFVNEAFATNWIAPLGPNVDGFEQDLASYTGSKHVAALSAGTAALHLALIMLGIKAGDEVICQSMTFSATANPIAYLGAIPVFIDSEDQTWNMCPDLLRAAIIDRIARGKKPKAIIPVHLYGMPAQMEKIQEIATEYQIPIIEDAAESLGSTIRGIATGTFGKMGVLSFNGNKIITTSGGGALISNDESYIKQARFLATQARDPAPHYQHSVIGYNYRMSNIAAGIGRGQMEVLEERVNQRRSNFDSYKHLLNPIKAIKFVDEPTGYRSNRWLTTILIDPTISKKIDRQIITTSLSNDDIECRPLWKPLHLQPVFKHFPAYINGSSEKLFSQGLCLPSGSNLTEEDLTKVASGILRCFK